MNRRTFLALAGAAAIAPALPKHTGRFIPEGDVLPAPDLLRAYMRPAVIAIAKKIENDLLSMYSLYTAAQLPNS